MAVQNLNKSRALAVTFILLAGVPSLAQSSTVASRSEISAMEIGSLKPEQATSALQSLADRLVSLSPGLLDEVFGPRILEDAQPATLGLQDQIVKGLRQDPGSDITISPDVITQSYKVQTIVRSAWDRTSNSLEMLSGDVFVEGYFRTNWYQNKKPSRPTFLNLEKFQPWFQWDSKSSQYVLRLDGAQEQLLKNMQSELGTSITLYRGLTQNEKDLVSIVHELRAQALSAADRARIIQALNQLATDSAAYAVTQAGVQKAAQDLSAATDLNQQKSIARNLILARYGTPGMNGTTESFFTTPTLKSAQGYGASNAVLQSQISVNDLVQLSRADNLYVGIEYHYFEIMFHGPEAIELYADHLITP